MRCRSFLAAGLLAASAVLGIEAAPNDPNVTNTVMMVDQWGNLNVAGVASVADVATNAVRVQIASAKSEAAMSTAQSVTSQLNGIVANIMSNNVVIYRSGYVDAFEGLVIYTDSDTLVICDYENLGITDGVLKARIDYVSSVNLGVTKPSVYAHDTCTNTVDFVLVPSASVTVPNITNEAKTIGGTTYDRWYSIDVSIPVAGAPNQYFYFIKLEADTPSGDGSALDLPNGVVGGSTVDLTWGDKILHFRGGVLRGVDNVQ